mmetsp:Transcript_85350/g.238221  ORF Transcript_85350/g.238221 Transcript_85350/m.238221 type:complete len:505 (-) Transcript_85350:2076-3590(-)
MLHGLVHACAEVCRRVRLGLFAGRGSLLRARNVVAVERPREVDGSRRHVSALARLAEATRRGCDREHPTAGGHNRLGLSDNASAHKAFRHAPPEGLRRWRRRHVRGAIIDVPGLEQSARVEDSNAGYATGPLKAGDHVPFLVRPRVAIASHDDGDRSRVGQYLDAGVRETALDTTHEHIKEVAIQQRDDGLRLRVTEAAIELDDDGAFGRQHQPGEKAAHKRLALGLEPVDGRLQHLLRDPLQHGRVDNRRRCESAHATSVGSLVAIESTFVVLRRRQHRDVRAIGKRKHRAFGALQALFEHDLLASRPHRTALQEVADGYLGFDLVLGDDHALPCREPAGLDDDVELGGVHVVQSGLQLTSAAEGLVLRCGDTMPLHEGLGEGFRGFDLSRRLRRPKHTNALGAQGVRDAVGEQLFRTDDHQPDVLLLAEVHDRLKLRALHLQVVLDQGRETHLLLRVARPDASVTWRAVYATHLQGPAQFPGQGVLPTARTEHEHRLLKPRH